ncbi:hypothetical protein ABPG72_018752 [Tetrahymena utriculariae]
MKFSYILLLLLLVIFAQADKQTPPLPGTVEQNCSSQGNTCDDDTNFCGIAGIPQNWTYQNGNCIVTDCNQLTVSGASVSNYACASCFTSGTSSAGINAINIYANTNSDACVSIDCTTLKNNYMMTTANCIVCVGPGSIVKSDNASCTSATKSPIILITSSLLFLTLLL